MGNYNGVWHTVLNQYFINTRTWGLPDLQQPGTNIDILIRGIFNTWEYVNEHSSLINTQKPEHPWVFLCLATCISTNPKLKMKK